MGFTQPQTDLPIIEDAQNNAKGFTSRLLWFFRRPVLCSLKETNLTPEESAEVKDFQSKLGRCTLFLEYEIFKKQKLVSQ